MSRPRSAVRGPQPTGHSKEEQQAVFRSIRETNSGRSCMFGGRWTIDGGRLLVCSLWLAACGLLTTGCVYRSLTIRTEPPGASVYVNDDLKGRSPVTYDFLWYGGYRVTIRKDGFERLDDRKQLRAPVHLWIPLDLVMELVPLPIHDTRTWSYVLTPTAAPVVPAPPQPTPRPTKTPSASAPAAGGVIQQSPEAIAQPAGSDRVGTSAQPANSPTSSEQKVHPNEAANQLPVESGQSTSEQASSQQEEQLPVK